MFFLAHPPADLRSVEQIGGEVALALMQIENALFDAASTTRR